ncbi:MAG: hypothetical protein ACREJC_05345 [Tepidisphaeraceae bacterium]
MTSASHTAAGCTLLCLATTLALGLGAPHARAAIVYHNIPDVTIENTDLAGVSFDVNDDGVLDFRIVGKADRHVMWCHWFDTNAGLAWIINGRYLATRYPSQFPISSPFVSDPHFDSLTRIVDILFTEDTTTIDGFTAFFGFRFFPSDDGLPRVGWLQASASAVTGTGPNPVFTVTLLDFAYETTPFGPILTGATPEPHPLAVVAINLIGTVLGRRPRGARVRRRLRST